MAVYRFQVTFPTDTALPADYVTNTWHFSSVGELPIITDFDNVRDMLDDFYSEVPTGKSNSIMSLMSNTLNTPALVKAYALEDPEPRAPVYESTFTGSYGSSSLPAEVALCLSFQATRASGQPQSRRRNRVYLGPFADQGTNQERPSAAMCETITAAARDLLQAADASVNWTWVIWSPTEGEDYEVNNGWVDNSWDTQRRRGVSPSTRYLWDDDSP